MWRGKEIKSFVLLMELVLNSIYIDRIHGFHSLQTSIGMPHVGPSIWRLQNFVMKLFFEPLKNYLYIILLYYILYVIKNKVFISYFRKHRWAHIICHPWLSIYILCRIDIQRLERPICLWKSGWVRHHKGITCFMAFPPWTAGAGYSCHQKI